MEFRFECILVAANSGGLRLSRRGINIPCPRIDVKYFFILALITCSRTGPTISGKWKSLILVRAHPFFPPLLARPARPFIQPGDYSSRTTAKHASSVSLTSPTTKDSIIYSVAVRNTDRPTLPRSIDTSCRFVTSRSQFLPD